MSDWIKSYAWGHILVWSLLLLLLSACGGRTASTNAGSSSAPADQAAGQNQPAAPTMPSGNFTAVGQQSILTDTSNLTSTTTTTATDTAAVTAEVDPALLSRGENVYTKNKCNECHGEQGEGVADKGSTIAGTTLSLTEFDTVLRTGSGLGNSHIFGRSAVSPSGMEALYLYVQSLNP